MKTEKDLDKLCIDTLKMLGVDTINNVNSGHPGIVLGAAAPLYYLYNYAINQNPKDPLWPNRDRFYLSAGHGSALLYSLLHLAGFDLTIDNLKNFRRPGNTPGHPEFRETPGVEATTGPLGQGVAMAVGSAIAEAHLNKVNGPAYTDYYTYCLCGDGDLQEGVAMEAISLAGRLKLNKLIMLFDSNNIQLDGPTSLTCETNFKLKFLADGWNYILVTNPYDKAEFLEAIRLAKESELPTVIEMKTTIGQGATKEATNKVHGSPLGVAERDLLAEKLGYQLKPFEVDPLVYKHFQDNFLKRGLEKYTAYSKLKPLNKQSLDFDLSELLAKIPEKQATRKSSGDILTHISSQVPALIGGSADLSSSTCVKGVDGDFDHTNRLGRNLNFGVREHSMAAIANGIAQTGVLRPFVSGFFVFSNYMFPAIRLSALQKLPVMYIFTHDSVFLGEDGPTHQPIEHLAQLRCMPNVNVIRPCDFKETLAAYKLMLSENDFPSVLVLTRQNVLENPNSQLDIQKGAYIIKPEQNKHLLTLIATGSEVSLAIEAAKVLETKGQGVRVVSMPSCFLFDRLTKSEQAEILGNAKIIAVEAGSAYSWYKYTPHVFGINNFGLSSSEAEIREKLKFTKADLVDFIENAVK